jgi:undecaprenyl diphosphate synthase
MWINELTAADKQLQNDLLSKVKLPRHIGIIMDGNGRWAESKEWNRLKGHREGVESVRDIVKACSQMGVKYLTLYSFSIENWNRPSEEVNGLMKLLEYYLKKEVADLHKNNVRIKTIGKTNSLPLMIQNLLFESIEKTKANTGLTLALALSYSSRWDIVQATQLISLDLKLGRIAFEDINENLFPKYLSTKDLPDVDLLIRTSGELRLSNFMLWEMAYGEIVITDKLWPDFRRDELYSSLESYAKRERRYGKTSGQVSNESKKKHINDLLTN